MQNGGERGSKILKISEHYLCTYVRPLICIFLKELTTKGAIKQCKTKVVIEYTWVNAGNELDVKREKETSSTNYQTFPSKATGNNSSTKSEPKPNSSPSKKPKSPNKTRTNSKASMPPSPASPGKPRAAPSSPVKSRVSSPKKSQAKATCDSPEKSRIKSPLKSRWGVFIFGPLLLGRKIKSIYGGIHLVIAQKTGKF